MICCFFMFIAYSILFIAALPLYILFLKTYLSPLHATFILFADFVYDSGDSSSKEWIALAISVAIWAAILLLYFLITLKLIKQDRSSNRYIRQTQIIYLIAYLPSVSFVIYYIVTYRNLREILMLGFQLFLLILIRGVK